MPEKQNSTSRDIPRKTKDLFATLKHGGAATGWTYEFQVIAIAHRLSTIRAYDEICVLQNGEIAAWWKCKKVGV